MFTKHHRSPKLGERHEPYRSSPNVGERGRFFLVTPETSPQGTPESTPLASSRRIQSASHSLAVPLLEPSADAPPDLWSREYIANSTRESHASILATAQWLCKDFPEVGMRQIVPRTCIHSLMRSSFDLG